MKVEIESTPVKRATVDELFIIVACVKNFGHENIDQVYDHLNRSGVDLPHLEVGRGSSHIWVKEKLYSYKKWHQMKPDVKVGDDRLMIITNN